MKVKLVGKKKVRKMAAEPEGEDCAGAIAALNRVFNQIQDHIFERSEEIDAIRYALIIKEHVMLEGTYGIAKSKLANQVFRRITGSNFFKKLMMKGTNTDEIFGPMNAQVYRAEARWEHNTAGFLPEAHFAFLDETYRSNDSLLGSMMGILNEREFLNGPVLMHCPLMTAIGTTNFITEDEQLDAFHDRWLIRAIVKPIQARNARINMLTAFADTEGDMDDDETISLEQIRIIQENLFETTIEPDVLELYEHLCAQTMRNMPGQNYLSDRRLCLTLKLTMADALLKGSFVVKPENLLAARFGLCRLNQDNETTAFMTAYEQVVGEYESQREERDMLAETKDWSAKMFNTFDPDLEERELLILRKRAEQGIATLESLTGPKAPKMPETVETFANIAKRLHTLVMDIDETPIMEKRYAKEKKTASKITAKNEAAAKVQRAINKNEDDDADPIESARIEDSQISDFSWK